VPRHGTTAARGYGHAHRAATAKLKANMHDGQPCARGGEPLYRWQLDLPRGHRRSIHGDHVGQPRALGGDLPDALTCCYHNTQHGGRLASRLRARGHRPAPQHQPRRQLAPQPKTSRDW